MPDYKIKKNSKTDGKGSKKGRIPQANAEPAGIPETKASTKAKREAMVQGFSKLWESLWSSSVHLDSALSKLPAQTKGVLAQLLPTVLMRPASQAEALGVGVPMGEPWSLSPASLGQWRPASLMMERMYELMSQGVPQVDPMKEDFPSEMLQEWENTWGKEVACQLVDTLGRSAPLSLRVNRAFGVTAVLNGLKTGEQLPVRVEASTFAPLGIRLAGYAPVLKSEWYQKGAFEIQDEGSQWMALFALWPEHFGSLLSEQPGRVRVVPSSLPPLPRAKPSLTVVDACAGAGGKSLAIADALEGRGKVFAYDTSPKKLQALRRRASRTQLRNIQVTPVIEGAEDAHVERFRGSADIVLVDAPCSGWGVLRRNPDIKWRQERDVLDRMPKIQNRLLDLYSRLVAPGGRLVYGVCTFRAAETRDIVQSFLSSHPEFVSEEGGFLGPGPCDGFFMQSFSRRA
jgi:16S rRNA C967 or C1407 C5-methylase (RsmB/RsmF family)